MDPDALIPFMWEIIWFSAGGLAYAISPKTHTTIGALLLFGGIIGSIARNYDPDERPLR